MGGIFSSQALALGGGFVILLALIGLAYAGWTLLNPTRTASDRLHDLQGNENEIPIDPALEKLAERLGSFAETKDQETVDQLRAKLIQAGYRHKQAVQIFNGIRVTGALSLPMLALPFAASAPLMKMATITMVAVAAGYYLPQMILNSQVEARQKLLARPFPDALDLLVSSVEAGLGLDSAFQRVASELESIGPELSFEFKMVNHEINAGVSRIDALKHLQERTGLDQVRSLVNMLSQAERFGTSIARSLRIHSHVARERRMAEAEEKAAQVSPKLTVVMILFLLPTLMAVLLGPAAVRIKNNLLDK
ncbi:MAG: type II secretion system F family protein [Deltaproteobacteria bacterium]|nr:type II secretion system F family protein [Deltaproteobacteria bacterium]